MSQEQEKKIAIFTQFRLLAEQLGVSKIILVAVKYLQSMNGLLRAMLLLIGVEFTNEADAVHKLTQHINKRHVPIDMAKKWILLVSGLSAGGKPGPPVQAPDHRLCRESCRQRDQNDGIPEFRNAGLGEMGSISINNSFDSDVEVAK